MYQNFNRMVEGNPDQHRLVCDAIEIMRKHGWAVVILTADEVDGVDVDDLESALVEDAFERISIMKELE